MEIKKKDYVYWIGVFALFVAYLSFALMIISLLFTFVQMFSVFEGLIALVSCFLLGGVSSYVFFVAINRRGYYE